MNPSVHAYNVGKMPPYTKQEDAKKKKLGNGSTSFIFVVGTVQEAKEI